MKDQSKRTRFRDLAETQENVFTGQQFTTGERRAKLVEYIERLKRRQGIMKRANELICQEDRQGLADLGFSHETIAKLCNVDLAGRRGFPVSILKSNSTNIRRLQKRLETLDKTLRDETTTLS